MGDLRHALGDVEGAVVQLLCAALQTGEIQHVVHQQGEPVGLLDDDVEVLFPLHRIVAGEIPDHLRIRFHHGEGRAQVVGYVGDEVTLHLVSFGKLLRRVVQRLRKIVHLRIAAALERCLIVAVRQTFGGGGDVDDGGGNVICREEREQEAEEYQQYRDDHGLPFQDGNGGLHRHQRRIQQQIAGDCLVLPVDGAAVDQHLAL